ncbi:recombinase family protein [Bradyrhizobium glycinis]|uniref:recombinase family protein n=1 Tax=Bradyrhizobium glycinis TaxID=2751812 RepID=UPI0018D775AE|nr:recombinase family protein [Bradyrhizobium glycinis]MBH5370502.1 recombinase family protein [Bradyrhizobium glycinis]
MANALMLRQVKLPERRNSNRAAQYVRMSTDYQRYSIENQAAAIAAYAQAHSLAIVRTYKDEGESGLRIKNRAGLIRLLEDVSSGQADFEHVLVYDVSRWGRFQDTDESAHYEFICKQAGIKVIYCAEQFDNDCSLLSSIVKNVKRVMAAEYSRELSVKVHAGQSRFASLGFLSGGRVGYALRRELVDPSQKSKGVLGDGERKYLTTDHVRVTPGPAEEAAVVRWIFQRFLDCKSETAIARELNYRAVPSPTSKEWDRAMIGRLLRNEQYIGNLIYNRRSCKLKAKSVYNSPDRWVRREGCIEPIIEPDIFRRVKKLMAERRVHLSENEMLTRLRRTLMKEGKLSPKIINRTIGLPCTRTYVQHFGSLRNVYRLIGYTSKQGCGYLDTREVWAELIERLASRLSAQIEKGGGQVEMNRVAQTVVVNGKVGVALRIARCQRKMRESHSSVWTIRALQKLLPGWIIVIRLTETNKEVLDYLLLPTSEKFGRFERFTERHRIRRKAHRFETFDALTRSLVRRLIMANRSSRAKTAQSR